MTGRDRLDLLLVEDDPDDARYVERLLTAFGTAGERLIEFGRITRAERLDEALELLDREPDVVLLDLGLPDSDGIDTIEALVEHAPHVPVVVVTGHTEHGLGTDAIRRGAQDYLRKGHITAEVLHRTIRYAVDRHETQREVVELNRRLSLLNRVVQQEVRNDVDMIVGRGDELRERLEGEPARTAASLLAAAHRAVEHIDTASELVTVLSSDADADLAVLDLRAVLEERVSRFQEDASISIEWDDDEVAVEASPLLGSAFEQLLSNAIEHNDRQRPDVTVSVDPSSERISVAIADDGVGIPKTRRALLDDPEARYHERSGIGTGLYHATTVIEQSGGDVAFAANEPRGTVVTVTLSRVRLD